jgi:hypothetical protein
MEADMQVQFDPGTYTTTVRFSNTVAEAQFDMLRLADTVGMPAKVRAQQFSTDYMQSRISRALALSTNFDERELLISIRVMKGGSDGLLEQAFGLVQIARMKLPAVRVLTDKLWRSIGFALTRVNSADIWHEFWIERLQVFTDVLSRLVIRFTDEEAMTMFRQAATLARHPDWKQWTLFEPLANLLQRSFTAVPPRLRQKLLLDIVSLPLPDERGLYADKNLAHLLSQWPEIVLKIPWAPIGRPADDTALASRISVLILKLRTDDDFTRERAMIRLLWLRDTGILKPSESTAFGEALWSKGESESGLPAGITSLRPHVALKLPGGDANRIAEKFRAQVLNKALSGSPDPDSLVAIVGAAQPQNNGERLFELQVSEALRLFDALLAWRAQPAAIDLNHYNLNMRRIAGSVLREAILPALPAEKGGKERIQRLVSCIESGTLPSAIIAVPDLVSTNNMDQKIALELTHRLCFDNDNEIATQGVSSIERWRVLAKRGALRELPAELRDIAVTIVLSGRQPGLVSALHLAAKLVEDTSFSQDAKSRLAYALGRLRAETEYSTWDPRDPRTISLALVRAACVNLAQKLRSSGVVHEEVTAWIENSIIDPVPEVRYALQHPNSDI